MDPLHHLRSALADQYVIEREIGRGGMAIVYLAHDLRHSRDVAIKVLRPEFAMAVSAERFLREIQIEGKLQHPNILPLLASGDANGLPYYAMPYVPGESLQARLIRDSPLPVAEAIRITTDVAEALAYAHELGFVHRDVKPGNILLRDGHAVLADFGIARAITEIAGDRLSDSGLVVGTPEYMSPEQGAAHGRVDGRSDIYSLGCVLYEMLAGEPPFTGPTAQAVIARHMHEPARSLRVVRSTVPEHIEEAIEVALAKVSADRFNTAVEFSAALGPEGKAISAAHRARRTRLSRARVLGGFAILASLGLWTSSVPTPLPLQANAKRAEAPSLSSIAVLYFEDRTESGKLDYLSAGLTEDLIDQLAAVKSLRVISPDGVRPYRGRSVPLDSLARVFNVGTIITGTLSRSGDRLRASVRLSDAENAVQLFSGTFEKPLGNVLDLRDTLAYELARQLRTRLGEAIQLEERRAESTSDAAWTLIRQAEQLREQVRNEPDSVLSRVIYRKADSLLIEAEKLDPNWTEPIIMRGWLASHRASWATGDADTAGAPGRTQAASWVRIGLQQAQEALGKDPGNPAALELRGTLRYQGWALTGFSGPSDTIMQLDKAEIDLRESANAPGRHQARALSTLSAVLQFSGRLAAAHSVAERAYEADAYLRDADAIIFRLFHTSLELRRHSDAVRWCGLGRRIFPKTWNFLYCELRLLAWSPSVTPHVTAAWNIVAALDTVAKPDLVPWLKPQMTMMVAAVLARRGLRDSAEQVMKRAKASAPNDPELLYYEALARVRNGQPAAAAHLIAELLRKGPMFLPFIQSHSEFKALWTDPLLKPFLE